MLEPQTWNLHVVKLKWLFPKIPINLYEKGGKKKIFVNKIMF